MARKPTTTVLPYLCCRDGVAALKFYEKAFGAVVGLKLVMPDGKLGHADFSIDGAMIMVADEFPNWDHIGPQTLKGTSVTIALCVPDVDATVAKAVAAGAKIVRPVKNQFYGHRSGLIVDPFGHKWDISTVIEKLSAEEIHKRAAEMFQEGDCAPDSKPKKSAPKKPAKKTSKPKK